MLAAAGRTACSSAEGVAALDDHSAPVPWSAPSEPFADGQGFGVVRPPTVERSMSVLQWLPREGARAVSMPSGEALGRQAAASTASQILANVRRSRGPLSIPSHTSPIGAPGPAASSVSLGGAIATRTAEASPKRSTRRPLAGAMRSKGSALAPLQYSGPLPNDERAGLLGDLQA